MIQDPEMTLTPFVKEISRDGLIQLEFADEMGDSLKQLSSGEKNAILRKLESQSVLLYDEEDTSKSDLYDVF